jgi:hypothetical protein
MRRIDTLNRNNPTVLRQNESAISSLLADVANIGHTAAHDQTDATLALIAARFTRYDVEKSGKGYAIVDRRTANPIARLRPIPNTDRFELFYWSNTKGRWTTFGNLGRMKLMLESAHEIVENDPMFRIPRRWWRW